jgi:Pectate lyase superfamily protein
MIPEPVELLSFIPTGATTKRSLADWAADPFLNVKNFGAKGDGVTDDTAAIQACLNAAFNQPAGNGINGQLNKPVYFPPPASRYIVTSPHTTSVTGTAAGAGGAVMLTVSSTAGFATGARVQVSGIVGTTEANGLWYITVNDATHMTLTASAFANAWISGGTVNAPALTIKNTQGAHIFGGSKLWTEIQCNTNFAPVISLDGFGYGQIDNLAFSATTGGIACDYSWSGNGVSSQEITFLSNTFGGGAYGLMIGATGAMSSETLMLHNFFSGTTAGLYIGNFNALAANVIGGNIAGCGVGILVGAGSCPLIHGVGFQGNTTADIEIVNSAADTYSIAACRSESVNFAVIHAGPGVVISGCGHLGGAAGTFLFYEGGSINSCIVDSCYSQNGTLGLFSNGNIFIKGGSFGNPNFLSAAGGNLKLTGYELGPLTVGALPPVAVSKGLRQVVTDSTVGASGNFGAIVAGSGGQTVPVFSDGINWRIG